jgi:hypothetical protein
MTNAQIAKLQELSKCYMPRRDCRFVDGWLNFSTETDRMTKDHKRLLRRLWHEYRNQIAAMRKNRK